MRAIIESVDADSGDVEIQWKKKKKKENKVIELVCLCRESLADIWIWHRWINVINALLLSSAATYPTLSKHISKAADKQVNKVT